MRPIRAEWYASIDGVAEPMTRAAPFAFARMAATSRAS